MALNRRAVPATPDDLLALFLRFREALSEVEGESSGDIAAAIARLSVQAVPGVEQASITERRRGSLRTLAATGAMATGADAIQYKLGGGPCVDAITDGVVYRNDDIGRDERWPEFGRRATAETGAVSMLSCRMFFAEAGDRMIGLNLYSTAPAAFSDVAQTMATVLSTHGARVLETATAQDKVAQLREALSSNREIGIAMGILMATRKVTRTAAFELLRLASLNGNRKLFLVAADVVDTGTLDQCS